MQIDTRQTIHMAVQAVIAPFPTLDADLGLSLQTQLNEAGVTYSTVNRSERHLHILRKSPDRLDIKLNALDPQRRLGRLEVSAPRPQRPLDAFADEAEIVAGALASVAGPEGRQMLSRAATLHDLYDMGGVHAFQQLWEGVLGQGPEKLQPFGKPVRGGGLRFVIPPLPGEDDPANIELKIESYLRETTRLYVEANVTWSKARPPGAPFEPRALLAQVDEYITQTVWQFMGAR